MSFAENARIVEKFIEDYKLGFDAPGWIRGLVGPEAARRFQALQLDPSNGKAMGSLSKDESLLTACACVSSE